MYNLIKCDINDKSIRDGKFGLYLSLSIIKYNGIIVLTQRMLSNSVTPCP